MMAAARVMKAPSREEIDADELVLPAHAGVVR